MKNIFGLSILFIALILSACKSENEKFIVGDWKLSSMEIPSDTPDHMMDPNVVTMAEGAGGQGIVYTFNEDGTMSIKSPARSETGTYELNDDTHMTLTIDGKKEILEEVYIDKLVFTCYSHIGQTRVFMAFDK